MDHTPLRCRLVAGERTVTLAPASSPEELREAAEAAFGTLTNRWGGRLDGPYYFELQLASGEWVTPVPPRTAARRIEVRPGQHIIPWRDRFAWCAAVLEAERAGAMTLR